VLNTIRCQTVALWVVMPRSLVGDYQSFGGTYCPTFRVEMNAGESCQLMG
jgi:hypothetical protein